MIRWKSFFKRLLLNLIAMIGILICVGLLTIALGRYDMRHHHIHNPETQPACYVAGRSGGHLIPAMTLAHNYRATHPLAPLYVFTANTQLDYFVMKKYPWVTRHVALSLGNVPRGLTSAWCSYLWDLIKTTAKIFNTLRQANPAFVATTGGYIAVPVCLVARALGIPIYLYNLDVAPGAAIHFLSRFATKVVVCFPETKSHLPPSAPVELGTYPIRFDQKDMLTKQEARIKLNIGLTDRTRILLVIGGSQGSQFISDLIPAAIAPWAQEKSIFVLHQSGLKGEEQHVRALYQQYKIPALVFPYRDDMAILYQAADLAITRAGAGSLFELIFFKTPAIIIPLVSATTAHQVDNAYAIARLHPELFTVILQEKIACQEFGKLVQDLLSKN